MLNVECWNVEGSMLSPLRKFILCKFKPLAKSRYTDKQHDGKLKIRLFSKMRLFVVDSMFNVGGYQG